MKNWEKRALELLNKSLIGLPHELNELDWKESLSPNHGKLSCHLSAFANNPGGGFMVFGIDNKTRLPVELVARDCEKIIGTLTNIAREALNPAVLIEHSYLEYKKHNLLFIFILESSIKPAHIKNKTIEDSYIRSGGSTRKASRNEVGGLMLNSHLPCWEELYATSLLSETEVLNLLDAHAIHQLLKRPIPSTNHEILHWLETEKMIKKSNGNGYYITNIGAVAAARNLNQFDSLVRKTIRVIRYKGTNKLVTEKEFPGEKGYAIGFNELIQFVRTSLPQSEIIRDAFRSEETVYPEITLRELIANALIHQDFTIHGKNPMIEIFDDRLEITNPGTLIPSKNVERLIGTSPESRNEILAQAFRRFHICEERGSGFIKTINAIELFGMPPLKFEEGENYFKVILSSPCKFADMSREERVQACYQHAVIRHLSGTTMTNTTLRDRFKMHEKQRAMISRLIKDSLAANVIKVKEGGSKSSKHAEYLPYWA